MIAVREDFPRAGFLLRNHLPWVAGGYRSLGAADLFCYAIHISCCTQFTP